jgi:esterase FrsA
MTLAEAGRAAPELPLDELKREVFVHARMHDLDPAALERVLARIDRASGEGTGCWPVEWAREADRYARERNYLAAARHFSLARFPYVDGEVRAAAYERCLACFRHWVQRQPGVERLILRSGDHDVPAYGARLGARGPLLVVMGGIVSVKEQWTQLLKADALGLPVIALDLPGTGEAPFLYGEGATERVGELVKSALWRARADRCVVLASSFSGPIFARVASFEVRIAGLVMAASPLAHFFEPSCFAKVPSVTKLALARAMGRHVDELAPLLSELAVAPKELASLRVPVTYIANLRDEIIPAADAKLVEREVPRGRVVGIDDVHGAPNRWREVGLEMMAAVVEMTGRGRTPFGLLVRSYRRLSETFPRLRA